MPIYFRGDITIDNYEFYGEFARSDKQANSTASASSQPDQGRQGQNRYKTIVRQFGGAYLLARFTTVAWSLWYGGNDPNSWTMENLQPWAKIRDWWNERLDELFWHPREFDHHWQVSYRLMKCEKEYRISDDGHEGFTQPLGQNARREIRLANPPPPIGEGSLKLFVVNDRADSPDGNKILADEIARAPNSWTVIKEIGEPAKKAEDRLLADLLAARPDKVVGIFSADDLRNWGVPISRSLSWERTVHDVVDATRRGDLLRGHTPPHLIITFDYDAALYLHTKPTTKNSKERIVDTGVLVFSIGGAEGDFASNIPGDMPGAQTAFVSVFSTLLYKQLEEKTAQRQPGKFPLENADRILATALVAKRRVLVSGFPINENGRPFHEQIRHLGGSKRKVPRLYYSEGIFSLHMKETRAGDPLRKAPDPLIATERLDKRRRFLDPLSDEAFALNIADQSLDSYRFRPRSRDGDQKISSIFDEVAGARKRLAKFAEQAADYVITGRTPKHVPICSFGKIKTADVGEIEHFRTIRQLLQAYLSNPAANRPLGIAVFGPPGSGKGFSVKNIMEILPSALRNLVKDDRHECNLTALSESEDLVHYFQLARNSVLRGKVPVLFFDEFDCTVGQTKFFWLKHFLGPLQDGEFLENHIIHPIGRAIFIFAGGVYRTFADFTAEMNKNSELVRKQLKSRKSAAQELPNFKGVDFLSRLHGHIDIAAFSPKDAVPEKKLDAFYYPSYEHKYAILVDPSYLMRRAFTLRSMLEFHLPAIFSRQPRREARIDQKIVRAMLATRTFLHGARSMEAIIRMSVLEGSDSFKIAHLPPDEQLNMHVESANFSYCLDQDVANLWSLAVAGPNRRSLRRPSQ